MARPTSKRATGRPTLGQWIDAADTAARRAYEEIIGNPECPDHWRDLIAEIFDPLRALLRRQGLRNGPITPAE